MSTRPPILDPARTLIDGQRLDQPTFHALYEAMPPGTRAELINGVVHMPSPVGLEHSRADLPSLMWLGFYQRHTPGVEALGNVSTALGLKTELQPDGLLRVLPEFGGRTLNDTRFVAGVPELLVEVAHTSRYTDLGPKFDDYERAGVLEYIVRSIEPDEVLWFILRRGRFVDLAAGQDGIYRSEGFPGLWLDPEALLAGDLWRLQEIVDLGCATPEHAAFVAGLAEARAARRAESVPEIAFARQVNGCHQSEAGLRADRRQSQRRSRPPRRHLFRPGLRRGGWWSGRWRTSPRPWRPGCRRLHPRRRPSDPDARRPWLPRSRTPEGRACRA